MLFHRRGLLWLGLAVRNIWWQRLDDDNCQNGVALPNGMCFPGQDSGDGSYVTGGLPR